MRVCGLLLIFGFLIQVIPGVPINPLRWLWRETQLSVLASWRFWKFHQIVAIPILTEVPEREMRLLSLVIQSALLSIVPFVPDKKQSS
jgi:hypothetical protein